MSQFIPHLTFTGIYGDMRRRGKELLRSIGGAYSGSLLVNETTHVLVDPSSITSLQSAKLSLAIEAGIPLLDYQWLEDSAATGRPLATAPYLIDIDVALPSVTATSGVHSFTARGFSPVEALRQAPRQASPANFQFFGEAGVSPGPSIAGGHSQQQQVGAATHAPGHLEKVASLGEAKSYDNPCFDGRFGEEILQDAFAGIDDGGGISGSSPGLPAVPEDQEISEPEGAAAKREGAISLNYIKTGTQGAQSSYPNTMKLGFLNEIDMPVPSESQEMSRSRPSLFRLAPPGAAPLQLSTVFPGAPASTKPTHTTLNGIRQHHNTFREPNFFSSIKILPGGSTQQEIIFNTGDAGHGAKMIYDCDSTTGRQIFAHVIIKSIYVFSAKPEDFWMEHHYLFTEEDLAERPAWAAALEGAPLEEGELLLSANVYHSPCNLLVNDFGVEMAGRRVIGAHKKQGRTKGKTRGPAKCKYVPVLSCHRAFDVMMRKMVPLNEALEDW